MLRQAVVVGLIGLVAGVACGRDHGAPRVRQLPKPDGSSALRGGGPPRSPRAANYKINAHLDVVKHQITATETLTWTNTGKSQVDVLPFHLYLNAFKNESSLFMQSSRGMLRGARANPNAWGWIQVDTVTINGQPPAPGRPFHTTGVDESVAELPLAQPIPAGGTVEVELKFTAQLPEVFARTGYNGDFHLVGQWFPKIGVRVGPPGAERWECRPLHVNTEFFADFGTYDVALTVPSTYVVAATGVLANAVESAGGTRTFTYHAEDVHDFAWMADPYMEVMTKFAKLEVGPPVEVKVFYRPEQRHYARRHLDAAVGSIERFSAWFVPYPWSIMTVIDPPVEAASGAGGMEYPTFVTTAGDTVFARRGLRLPEYVTVHEVGHNWFQGMLASNEPEEAWLDEGVNEWADAKVMADLYGSRSSGIDWMGWQAEVADLRLAVEQDPDGLPSPIATAAYAFVDNRAYGEATYSKTLRAFRTLEQTIGSQKFMAAMKAYAKQWEFRHPTGRDLFATLAQELGQDLSWFFGPVFHEVGGIELAIRSASCRGTHKPRGVFDGEPGQKKLVTESDAPETGGFVCDVVVTNAGVIHVPVDIELRFADGSTQRLHWDDRGAGHWERFTVERSSRLVEVVLDPDAKIALGDPMTRRFRLEGDGGASLRAAAWFGSAALTFFQIVGP